MKTASDELNNYEEDQRFDRFAKFVLLPILLTIPLTLFIITWGMVKMYFNNDLDLLLSALEKSINLLQIASFLLGSGLLVFFAIGIIGWISKRFSKAKTS